MDTSTQRRDTAPAPLLRVRELAHTYGTGAGAHRAIDRLDFCVNSGEFVCIVGPSGCGKSTLMRTISGLLSPTNGIIELEGREIAGVPKDLAMVFQDYSRSLFSWMTVRRNVEFVLGSRELDKDLRRARVAESLEAVGLGESGEKYPWQLSGGMQQRVAIARALAYRPRILLMDEPFASVDAQTRADLEDLVLNVQREFAITILFVTHDIDESVYLADRVIVLSSAPTHLVAEIEVPLSKPRDQIDTKELPAFVHARGEVARLIRRPPPSSDEHEPKGPDRDESGQLGVAPDSGRPTRA